MGTPHYAIFATLSHFGRVVEETSVQQGVRLQVGNSPALSVPVPEDAPYLALVSWRGRDRARVTDGRGQTWELAPEEEVIFTLRDLQVTFRMVPQFRLSRAGNFSWSGSTVLLGSLLCTMVLFDQWQLLVRNQCVWFGINCPVPVAADSPWGGFEAQYLERLLRKDLDGFEDGVVTPTETERFERKEDQIYLPAGNKGPYTEMGGAEESGPEVVRTPRVEADPAPAPPKPAESDALLLPAEQGTPLDLNVPSDASADATGLDEPTKDEEGEDTLVPEAPTEDREGWGLPDWYDANDARRDDLEIEIMLTASRRRLLIDPNDPYALSILSYYQYLAEDYDAAIETYDKYIAQLPDESAGYNNKALIYKRRGDYATEEGLYRVALALDPGDPTAINNLAVCLAHQGRFDEALALMSQLETLDPDDAYADLHRAKIHAEMGNDEEALRYVEKALQGMKALDTLHHIEFRQDLRIDPSFEKLRQTYRFRAMLVMYYGKDSPLQE